MKQFLLSKEQAESILRDKKGFRLSGKEYHYLIRVLRFVQDDSFTGVDSAGNTYSLKVKSVTKEHALVTGEPAATLENEYECPWTISLFQCLPKGKKMDTVIRQTTEAGADKIIPVISEHSVSRPDEHSGSFKLERWEKIAVEATQQCGRPRPPEILQPKPFMQYEVELKKPNIGLFFHQEPLANSGLHGYLSNIPNVNTPVEIGIVIGPEGGLSDTEISRLNDWNYQPVYLGRRILRTETAPVYALGAIQTILLERNKWRHVKE